MGESGHTYIVPWTGWMQPRNVGKLYSSGKEGEDSILPEGLCAAFGPRWVGTCIRVLLGLQRPAGSADVGIYIYIYIYDIEKSISRLGDVTLLIFHQNCAIRFT